MAFTVDLDIVQVPGFRFPRVDTRDFRQPRATRQSTRVGSVSLLVGFLASSSHPSTLWPIPNPKDLSQKRRKVEIQTPVGSSHSTSSKVTEMNLSRQPPNPPAVQEGCFHQQTCLHLHLDLPLFPGFSSLSVIQPPPLPDSRKTHCK